MRILALSGSAILALALAACGGPGEPAPEDTAPTAAETPAETGPETGSLDWAVAGSWRGEDAARDSARHPAETLAFFGIEPDDTVIELWPGGGWYSRILAPYLAAGGGELIAAGFDPAAYEEEERRARVEGNMQAFMDGFASDPDLFGTVTRSALSNVSGPLAEPESADVVLTFRNIHNWMSGGYLDKVFADAYAALKPGGVLGVVEHRLPSVDEQDPVASSGYVHEDFVIAAAERAGFVLEDSAEINANPADTADHPFGVWTLPPVSRTTDRDGEAPEGFDPTTYLEIGESDRMTLKFRKPAE